MKNLATLFSAAAVLGLCSSSNISAATQVYDLKADWSDTQNPNGTWSYRLWDGSLLPNDYFGWGYLYSEDYGNALMRITQANAVPGYREAGDIIALTEQGVNVRWTAPATGTINISGSLWDGAAFSSFNTSWRLTVNGVALSSGGFADTPRSSPADMSLGSGGANALLNVRVEAGDQVELALEGYAVWGVNFTIALTTDSVDPVSAIQQLAESVAAMNLQNGIENSLDAKLDAALEALDDLNTNNDVAACNALSAFISAVEAQRGNKLTDAQADQLIAAAVEIQTALNCGN